MIGKKVGYTTQIFEVLNFTIFKSFWDCQFTTFMKDSRYARSVFGVVLAQLLKKLLNYFFAEI